MLNLILILSNLAFADSYSLPHVPYDKSYKVGDCFSPKQDKNSVFYLKIEAIKKDEYRMKMLFQTGGLKIQENEFGYMKNNVKNDYWTKTPCPVALSPDFN